MVAIVLVGHHFYRKNESSEDYYVGGRDLSPTHVGLSIAATDVGGGFSIGLGGLGFSMGLAGSWLLFTGLVGAWVTAVLVIPRVKAVDRAHGLLTYPDFLRLRYGSVVAGLAALVSGLGYLGFTAAQMLAGAKLSANTLITEAPLGLSPLSFSLAIIAVVTIGYTVLGGMKAVVATDTVQWVVLLAGLLFAALPAAIWRIGGFAALAAALPAGHLDLFAVSPVVFLNWMVTIIPIWFIAMTLYQRMYACRDEKAARRAWFVAGLFEWPCMAFSGVLLGMCARVLIPGAEAEAGLPLLIKDCLPLGIRGIVVAAYFSAIMSTADSCLMASSGNVTNDLVERLFPVETGPEAGIRRSRIATALLGLLAVLLAWRSTNVLQAILHAYGFLVAGLFVPTLGALFWKRASASGALLAILGGGGATLALQTGLLVLPGRLATVGLDPSCIGMLLSVPLFVLGSLVPLPLESLLRESADPSGDPT